MTGLKANNNMEEKIITLILRAYKQGDYTLDESVSGIMEQISKNKNTWYLAQGFIYGLCITFLFFTYKNRGVNSPLQYSFSTKFLHSRTPPSGKKEHNIKPSTLLPRFSLLALQLQLVLLRNR